MDIFISKYVTCVLCMVKKPRRNFSQIEGNNAHENILHNFTKEQ